MTNYRSQYFLKQINLYLLLMLFMFPILPLRISAIIMLAYSFSSLINYFLNQKVKLHFNYLLLLALIFPSLYLINYLIYPQSFEAWFAFEKRIALLAMPLVFAISKVHIKKSTLFAIYNMTVFVLGCYVLIYLLIYGLNPAYAEGGLSYAIRTTIEDITAIHPTYFSLFAGFSFYIIFNDLIKINFKLERFLPKFINLLILVVLLVLLASRIFFLSTLIIVPLIIFKSRLKLLYKAGLIGLFCVLFALSFIFIPGINQRISELNSIKTEIPGNDVINSTNLRSGIYYCSFELLKQNLIFGIGTANLQQELNNCYASINIDVLYEKNYNTHNEYINIWLGLGLVGLCVFLSILFFSFKKSLANDEHFIFISLFCIFCLTENLLARQHGVFSFVILNYYFIFSNPKQVKLPD